MEKEGARILAKIKEKEYVRGRGCGYWDDYCDGYGYNRRGVDNGARALGIIGTGVKHGGSKASF